MSLDLNSIKQIANNYWLNAPVKLKLALEKMKNGGFGAITADELIALLKNDETYGMVCLYFKFLKEQTSIAGEDANTKAAKESIRNIFSANEQKKWIALCKRSTRFAFPISNLLIAYKQLGNEMTNFIVPNPFLRETLRLNGVRFAGELAEFTNPYFSPTDTDFEFVTQDSDYFFSSFLNNINTEDASEKKFMDERFWNSKTFKGIMHISDYENSLLQFALDADYHSADEQAMNKIKSIRENLFKNQVFVTYLLKNARELNLNYDHIQQSVSAGILSEKNVGFYQQWSIQTNVRRWSWLPNFVFKFFFGGETPDEKLVQSIDAGVLAFNSRKVDVVAEENHEEQSENARNSVNSVASLNSNNVVVSHDEDKKHESEVASTPAKPTQSESTDSHDKKVEDHNSSTPPSNSSIATETHIQEPTQVVGSSTMEGILSETASTSSNNSSGGSTAAVFQAISATPTNTPSQNSTPVILQNSPPVQSPPVVTPSSSGNRVETPASNDSPVQTPVSAPVVTPLSNNDDVVQTPQSTRIGSNSVVQTPISSEPTARTLTFTDVKTDLFRLLSNIYLKITAPENESVKQSFLNLAENIASQIKQPINNINNYEIKDLVVKAGELLYGYWQDSKTLQNNLFNMTNQSFELNSQVVQFAYNNGIRPTNEITVNPLGLDSHKKFQWISMSILIKLGFDHQNNSHQESIVVEEIEGVKSPEKTSPKPSRRISVLGSLNSVTTPVEAPPTPLGAPQKKTSSMKPVESLIDENKVENGMGITVSGNLSTTFATNGGENQPKRIQPKRAAKDKNGGKEITKKSSKRSIAEIVDVDGIESGIALGQTKEKFNRF